MNKFWAKRVEDFPHDTGFTALSLLAAELLLRNGFRGEAIKNLERAFIAIFRLPGDVAVITCGEASGMRLRRPLAKAVSKLEAVYQEKERFQVRCRELSAEYPNFAPAFTHWYLEPANIDSTFENTGRSFPREEMTWTDPLSDCAYSVDESDIEMLAANGREMWMVNRSAPRLLVPVNGDFALETTVTVALDDRPAMGGLLLWQDDENYMCMDWGQRRPDEISFEGCIENEDLVFGRGKLPGDEIRLRLERSRSQVRALCSADGETWYTAGQTEFPVGDDIQTGLFGIGHIDRAVTPGAFPDGTAIHFRDTRILR